MKSGSTPNRLRKQQPDSGKPTTEASSGRSSHDSGRRTHRTEPDAERDIPLTGPIIMNEGKDIPHEDTDIKMQPPSSQPIASSPARHQAQSGTSAPPVPRKETVNIASEVDPNSQRRENQEENESSGREQQHRQHQAHEEQRPRQEREGKEREKEEWPEQQTKERHAREERERESKEREKEERRNVAIEKKKRELKELKTQVAEATAHYQGLTRTNQQLKEEVNALNSEWHHDLQLLEAQRQVLNASRSFAAREGTLDAATLIQSFNDLNSLIGDFSFEVLRGLDEKADTRSLEPDDYKLLYDTITDQSLKSFVEQLASRELKASDVVDPIVTGILAADLMSTIFRPFAPGLDKNRSNVLKHMYKKMQESEPQERSARWRSIAYSHAIPNPEPDFLQQAANGSVSNVMGVLTALSGGKEYKFTKEYFELAHRIFEAAVKVQDRAKKEYVSFDYEVYSVRANSKYDKTMDVSQAGKDDPSQVWITIGLGMRASRSIQEEGNILRVERSIPVKPMVICDNWDHNA